MLIREQTGVAVTDAPYQDSAASFAELRDLLVESYAIAGRPDNWMAGRLEDWRYGSNAQRDHEQPGFWSRNAHVWRDEQGRLIGCCIAEYGDDNVYLLPHPRARWLEEPMLDWAEAVWAAGRPALSVYGFAGDNVREALLRSRGYADDGECGRLYGYDLSRSRPIAPLPDGFRLSSLAADHNIASHIAAVSSAFGRASLDAAWYAAKAAGVGYAPEWDLAVVGQDGEHVAFCTVRRDFANGTAELDPIGTRPEYQQRGLAKALVSDCFARLAADGIRTAYIGAGPEPAVGNRLYVALRPDTVMVERTWRKVLGRCL